MLDKVIKESREKFQQSSENIENQYQLSEIPKKIAKSGKKSLFKIILIDYRSKAKKP